MKIAERHRGEYMKDIDRIRSRLIRGERVHQRWGAKIELHLDRRLPFLCVYRHTPHQADVGTSSLLNGQAAYLQAVAEAACHRETVDLLDAIAAARYEAFGNFLVLELWAGAVDTATSDGPQALTFWVHATERLSNRFIGCVESALQGVTLREEPAEVYTVFDECCSPPGLPSLMSCDRMRELNCVAMGLEVDPVYRDPESGALLPFALEALRRGLSHALKMIFYRFSHDHTSYYPDHYHELGPRVVTDAVLEIDRQLADISENFDLLLHVTPINAGAAWTEFETSNFDKIPTFHYRPREVDPALLKRSLYLVPVEQAEDPTLIDLFTSKRDELDRQLTLLYDRGTGRFIHGSIQIFGDIDDQLLDTAEQLISITQSGAAGGTGQVLGPEALASRARKEIEFYRNSDPTFAATVEVRDDITGILVSHGNFLIGSDAGASDNRLRATLNHEIGTHALTYHNGRRQPLRLLYAGLAGYEELQEGLAVLAEYLSGGLTLSRLRLLAGRVIAVHSISRGADFVETFRRLHRDHDFEPFTAYTMTMRVFRGGGYTKDMIYLRGFLRLLEHLAAGAAIDLLFHGKIAMEHLHLLEELQWRRVLRPNILLPRYLTDEEPRRRFEILRHNATLEHILGNVI